MPDVFQRSSVSANGEGFRVLSSDGRYLFGMQLVGQLFPKSATPFRAAADDQSRGVLKCIHPPNWVSPHRRAQPLPLSTRRSPTFG